MDFNFEIINSISKEDDTYIKTDHNDYYLGLPQTPNEIKLTNKSDYVRLSDLNLNSNYSSLASNEHELNLIIMDVDEQCRISLIESTDSILDSNKDWKWSISEESNIQLIWSLIMALFLIANLVTIPFEIIQEPFVNDDPIQLIFVQMLECIFIIDIVFNFLTSFKKENGVEETSLKEIANNYILNWFIIDLVSSFPTTSLNSLGIINLNLNNSYIKIIKMPKQVKVLRTLAHLISTYLQYIFIDMLDNIIDISSLVKIYKMIVALVVFVFVANILTCFQVSLVHSCDISNNIISCPRNWFQVQMNREFTIAIHNFDHDLHALAQSLEDSADYEELFQHQIISSYRWVIQVKAWYQVTQTVTTVGYGDITSVGFSDNLYRMFCMMVGVILFTQVSSAIMEGSILDSMDNNDRFNRKSQIDLICKRYSLQKDARKQVNLLAEGIFTDELIDELNIIKMLPNQMSASVLHSIKQTFSQKFKIFSLITNLEFFENFQSKSQFRKCIIEELVSTNSDKLFLVQNGKLGIKIRHTEQIMESEYIRIIQTGDEFGYDSIMYKSVNNYQSTVCIDEVELIWIKAIDFLQIIEHYPDQLKKHIIIQYSENVQELQGTLNVYQILQKLGHQIDQKWQNLVLSLLNFTDEDNQQLYKNQKQFKSKNFVINEVDSIQWYDSLICEETAKYLSNKLKEYSYNLIDDFYKKYFKFGKRLRTREVQKKKIMLSDVL